MIHSRVAGKNKRFVFGHNRRSSPVEYVVKSMGFITPCWIWQRSVSSGYGMAWDGTTKKMVRAHRLMYERYRGHIEEGLQLDHLCRVRNCVNPDHLEPVTMLENIRRGEASKLNQMQVEQIRHRCDLGESGKSIAKDFNIAPAYVTQIRRRKRWK
jgi:hypothetical protein